MKLLYLAPGRSIHTKKWLQYFIDKGHKVFLITAEPSETSGLENEFIFPFKQKGGSFSAGRGHGTGFLSYPNC